MSAEPSEDVAVQGAALSTADESPPPPEAELDSTERRALDRTADQPTALARYRARQALADAFLRNRAERLAARGLGLSAADLRALEDVAEALQRTIIDGRTSEADDAELERGTAGDTFVPTDDDVALDEQTRVMLGGGAP